jgi:hypothetical protein
MGANPGTHVSQPAVERVPMAFAVREQDHGQFPYARAL